MPILNVKCSVNREAIVDSSNALHIIISCIYRRDNFSVPAKAVRTWRSYRAEASDPKEAVLYSTFTAAGILLCDPVWLIGIHYTQRIGCFFFSRSLTIYIQIFMSETPTDSPTDDPMTCSIPSRKRFRYSLK